MKLVFSEWKADYQRYVFPYAVWAIREEGETPADFFELGFLPGSKDLDRFYLCRNLRIRLSQFEPSSENRRILRKGRGIECELVPRSQFEYTPERRSFYKEYCDIKFGVGVMPWERLDALFSSKLITHLLLFTDQEKGREVGTVTLYLEPPRVAFYYFAFYDLSYYRRNLGIYMMTRAVLLFQELGYQFLYLGSVYSQNALYKTQFKGAEFFNGVEWSRNLKELKYLVRRSEQIWDHHLLENEEYLRKFHQADLGGLFQKSPFRLSLPSRGKKPKTS